MKIVELIRDCSKFGAIVTIPTIFRVGNPVVEGGYTVSEILYCRDGYSGGAKGRRPSYAIKFSDTSEIRVIPENEVIDIAVVEEEKKGNRKSIIQEATVELPE
jgi:hypothetical protein